jgi:hypothetical protein
MADGFLASQVEDQKSHKYPRARASDKLRKTPRLGTTLFTRRLGMGLESLINNQGRLKCRYRLNASILVGAWEALKVSLFWSWLLALRIAALRLSVHCSASTSREKLHLSSPAPGDTHLARLRLIQGEVLSGAGRRHTH